ncbi:hypothetical protein BDZ97DRAFT_1754453 [Flammula alnicola]|nr:hypothetical protein BDZ97DRAFT_1754453 [Flammula alnicola]
MTAANATRGCQVDEEEGNWCVSEMQGAGDAVDLLYPKFGLKSARFPPSNPQKRTEIITLETLSGWPQIRKKVDRARIFGLSNPQKMDRDLSNFGPQIRKFADTNWWELPGSYRVLYTTTMSWRALPLDVFHLIFDVLATESFTALLEGNPKIATYVKTLNLCIQEYYLEEGSDLPHTLDQLHNIKSFSLSTTKEPYWKAISQPLLSSLERIIQSSNLIQFDVAYTFFYDLAIYFGNDVDQV